MLKNILNMAKSPWGSGDDSRGSQNGSGSDDGRRPPNKKLRSGCSNGCR